MAKSSFLSQKLLSFLGALKDKQTLSINWKWEGSRTNLTE